MLSSLHSGLVPFTFNFIITLLSVDPASLLTAHNMTKPSKFVVVDYLNNG